MKNSPNRVAHRDVSYYLTMFFTLVTELLLCVVIVENKNLITMVHHTTRSAVKSDVKKTTTKT